MTNMTIFDLCPDIEEIIQRELDVLLKFREATKELKLRIKLNEKSIKACDEANNGPVQRLYGVPVVGMPRILLYSLFPYICKKKTFYGEYNKILAHSLKNVEYANIHGFMYNCNYNRYEPNSKWENDCTMTLIDDKLTELGEKRFKSKKKEHKIKLLMKY